MIDVANLLLRRLREAVEPHGAVSEFCRKTRLPRKTVDNWLIGRSLPSLENLETIATGLGVAPWQLLKPEGAEPAPAHDSSALLRKILPALAALDDHGLEAVLELIRGLNGEDAVPAHRLK